MKTSDCGLQNSQLFSVSGSRHCTTCQCDQHEHTLQQSQLKLSNFIETDKSSILVRSRLIPLGDPSAAEVGTNVMPDRTVWMKSVSPRPSRITIRVSSPDRPNLVPSS